MKREELIAYDKWLTRRKWGTGEIISPEKAADLYLAEHPLPPAEGAEEIFRECFAEEAVKRGDVPLSDEKWNDLVKESGGFMFRAMKRFATLHAQRTAEKMVSERMKKVESLLNMAAGLVGNPCTNISSSCDIACDDWQGEYNEYLKSKEK
jgi:hypothetical protein